MVIALGFIYPHKLTEFLEKELSQKLIQSYRDDLDFQNIIDLIQQDFECCGLSSVGYEDWNNNEYFHCTDDVQDNPSVERYFPIIHIAIYIIPISSPDAESPTPVVTWRRTALFPSTSCVASRFARPKLTKRMGKMSKRRLK